MNRFTKNALIQKIKELEQKEALKGNKMLHRFYQMYKM